MKNQSTKVHINLSYLSHRIRNFLYRKKDLRNFLLGRKEIALTMSPVLMLAY